MYVFATSTVLPLLFRLLPAALSSSFSQLSNYSETTVCAILLTRTRSLSYSLFIRLSAFPWLLLQTTTTITTHLSSRHNTVWKIDHRQFFILHFFRHQSQNTQFSFSHKITIPWKNPRSTEVTAAFLWLCVRQENHPKLLIPTIFFLRLIPFARSFS